MEIGKLSVTEQQIEKEKEDHGELAALQKKVLEGGTVTNLEYNKILTKLKKTRRSNWRTFKVELLVEAQFAWEKKDLKEHILLLFEDSLFKRRLVKISLVRGRIKINS